MPRSLVFWNWAGGDAIRSMASCLWFGDCNFAMSVFRGVARNTYNGLCVLRVTSRRVVQHLGAWFGESDI